MLWTWSRKTYPNILNINRGDIVDNKWIYIACSMAWFSTAIAISVAIYVSKSVCSLWFLLLPAMIRITDDDK